ncbi:hypothetical protein LCGC14_2001290 [marine sediment metagenome]|uniref:Secretion system C-terminal sorting domain-containing protein n=1 Tax=marine sediment metagenome TaxID=412755 RepID=A0A0F9FQW1_9ZZZZ
MLFQLKMLKISYLMIWKFILILSIIITLASNNLFATTYYVSNSGNDTINSGLSPADSWLTIDKVNNTNLVAGDSVLFNRNDTWNKELKILKSGSSGLNIVFGAYGEGSKPIIDLLSQGDKAISCSRSYITIQDLILKNSPHNGLAIDVTGGAKDINVFRVEIFNAGKNALAVRKGGSDFLIDGVRVINAKNNGIYFSGTELNKVSNVIVQNCYVSGVRSNDGIVVHQNSAGETAGSNFIIRNNYAELCAEQGFDVTTGSDIILDNNISKNNLRGGVVVGHSANNVTIQRHTSLYEPTQNTAAAIILGATNVKLIYSQIIGNGNHLVWIKKNETDTGDDNIEIYNNVFAWDGGGTMMDITEEIDVLKVKNNIFTTLKGNMGTAIRFQSVKRPPSYATYEFDNNLYYSPDGDVQFYFEGNTTYYSLEEYKTTFKQGQNSFSANPEFVNLDSSDFHLTSISPAIDKGIDVGLTFDFDSTLVPYNSIPDIGAFEYSLPTSVMENSSFLDVLLYPNPVNDFLFITSGMKIKDAWVVNMQGQYMDVEIVNSSINTSSLKNGLYCLKLESEKEIFTTKFIVRH